MIASLPWLDTFAKIGGSRYCSERKLDWNEIRPSNPAT
jgi:hypothetical protein